MNEQMETTEIIIDFRKIFLTLWNRKFFMIKIFTITLAVFVLMTFIRAKKYEVTAELYINKASNSNLAEFNPYFMDETSGLANIASTLANGGILANELEFIKSPLVMDKVIKENNIKYKKIFGIFPTKKTGKYVKSDKFAKTVKLENIKGTNIMSIKYKNGSRKLAYGVVTSMITNYIELYRQINSEKSDYDVKIMEAEYAKAKAELNTKMKSISGVPASTLGGSSNLVAMSTFSTSAQQAMNNIQSQFIAGQKSQIEVQEEAEKIKQLATKLEWAKMVQSMSGLSKVLILEEPVLPQPYEQASPKLFKQIILGIIFGIIFSIIGVVLKELTDKKLTYSAIGDNIIYDLDKEFNTLSAEVISDSDKKTAFIFFEEMSKQTYEKFKDFINVVPVKADISNSFKESLKVVDNVITFASIGKTDSEKYKLVKKMISNLDKKIIYEVLV